MSVLYLGMGDDIFTPFILVPELTTLYVIDTFDPAYSSKRTIESQREDIVQMLTDGDNTTCLEPEYDICSTDSEESDLNERFIQMKSRAVILSDQVDGNCWRLRFTYAGRTVDLVRFEQDFSDPWPKEIQNIEHILGIGSCHWQTFVEHEAGDKPLVSFVKARSSFPLTFYVSAAKSQHKHFPFRKNVKNTYGEKRDIGYTIIPNVSKWEEKIYNLNYMTQVVYEISEKTDLSFKEMCKVYTYARILGKLKYVRDIEEKYPDCFTRGDEIAHFEQLVTFWQEKIQHLLL